jgi:hypothetical protein
MVLLKIYPLERANLNHWATYVSVAPSIYASDIGICSINGFRGALTEWLFTPNV